MDKRLFSLTVLLFCSQFLFSQLPVTVVIKDPTWSFEDKTRVLLETSDRAKTILALEQQVLIAQQQLNFVKDATQKLRSVNQKIANYKNLEDCLVYTYNAYDRLAGFLKTIGKTDCFSISEIQMINLSFQTCLALTTQSINQITVVVTDNLADMGDSDRMFNLQVAIKQLREDLGSFYSLMQEVDILYNQRLTVRTFQVFTNCLK